MTFSTAFAAVVFDSARGGACPPGGGPPIVDLAAFFRALHAQRKACRAVAVEYRITQEIEDADRGEAAAA